MTIIGTIAVKIWRRACKATRYGVGFADQLRDCAYLVRNSFRPGTPDSRFAERYYTATDTGRPRVEGIVCICDGRMLHGGPTDRLRGILTTYREARRRGIPFYISWTSPFPLEDYLVPAGFDWRIKQTDICASLAGALPVIIDDLPNLFGKMRLRAALARRKPQTHVYTNSDEARGEYAALYREVFRPSEALQREVDRHLAILGSRYFAFTFRFLQLLGDFEDYLPTVLPPEQQNEFMEMVEAEMLRLVAGLPADCRILVTSDSRRFLDHVRHIDERIYVVPGDVKNVDRTQGDHKDAWMKTFVDQQLLMHASRVYLMRTGAMYPSGFPRFAAEIGRAEFVYHNF